MCNLWLKRLLSDLNTALTSLHATHALLNLIICLALLKKDNYLWQIELSFFSGTFSQCHGFICCTYKIMYTPYTPTFMHAIARFGFTQDSLRLPCNLQGQGQTYAKLKVCKNQQRHTMKVALAILI